MILHDQRLKIIEDINIAISEGARKEKACDCIGLEIRTMQRWSNNIDCGDKRPNAIHVPKNLMSQEEENEIIKICNSDEYKDMTPNEIVPILAQKGIYIASESTFYRVLKKYNLLTYRSNCKPPQARRTPLELVSTGPDQVWSWDISYLLSAILGKYFYLYLFMDVWSRKITGHTVELCEDGKIASDLISKISKENNLKDLRLHSDNGAPMKCGTMLATLQWLGIAPSFSRPSVSNDNPYSESLFKTLKYCPAYPKSFETIEEARAWVDKFVAWYNNEHHHSGIKYVTPNERHSGEDVKILEQRKETYRLAQMKNPSRWSKETRNWEQIKEVVLNRKTEKIETEKIA